MTSGRISALRRLKDSVLDPSYVSIGNRRTASPHEFYRYPARFAPAFARAAIEAFTDPGDLVLDPFVGGGTTLVEARLASRSAIGSDLNPLAVFVSRAKARPILRSQLDCIQSWVDELPKQTRSSSEPTGISAWVDEGYLRNIDAEELRGVRNLLGHCVQSLGSIDSPAAQDLARCAVLRTGQWALDMRSEVPDASEVLGALVQVSEAMVVAARDYARDVRAADAKAATNGRWRTRVLEQGVPGLARRLVGTPPPRLLLTSPPYPGVYVNYHRWKVRGRRETPAPFWLAERSDGNGLSYYTMSARADKSLDRYFEHLEAAFGDVASVCGEKTTLVQMVGFHEPLTDLPRYLKSMSRAGFREVRLASLATGADGRLWREVPNRRWWTTHSLDKPNTATEVVLIHRLR